MIETQRAFVNTWECDENDHMNVQFYWKRFGDAGQFLTQKTLAQRLTWIDRHVLYQSEMGAGTTTLVRSQNLTGGAVHILSDGESGAVSATAIDRYGHELDLDGVPEHARPRSLPVDTLDIEDADSKIAEGLGLVSHMSAITSAECDSKGELLDQYHISRFADAGAHLWGFFSISRAWLHENNYGSAAVEMKVTRHNPARAGMLVEISSWLEEVRAKTFSFRHQVREIERGTVLYSGAVTALVMDLQTRKALTVPDQIAALR